MLAIGNNELAGRPQYRKGTRVQRLSDGKVFIVEVGTDAKTGKETNLLGCITEGDKSFMVGLASNLLDGWDLANEPSRDSVTEVKGD